MNKTSTQVAILQGYNTNPLTYVIVLSIGKLCNMFILLFFRSSTPNSDSAWYSTNISNSCASHPCQVCGKLVEVHCRGINTPLSEDIQKIWQGQVRSKHNSCVKLQQTIEMF